MRNWFYIEDKKVDIKQLNKFVSEAIERQKSEQTFYKKRPNTYLIRNGKGELLQVSKNYYLYHTKDDDYDTELELDDVEDDV